MVTKFEIHIVSHYQRDRVKNLSLVLDGLLGWKNVLVHVIITSNVDTYQSSGFLDKYARLFEDARFKLELNIANDLRDPFLLTWEHKKYFEPWLKRADPENDFFMYIEDDIVVLNKNIEYFLETQKLLETHSLIPGFIRYEVVGETKKAVDLWRREYWQRDRSITIDGIVYHANINAYWAGFILDRRRGEEFIRSRSFSVEESKVVSHWTLRARAAMGLTFENPTRKLRSRVVVPMIAGFPDDRCYVWHCSNNYSINTESIVATLSPEQVFLTENTRQFVTRRIAETLEKIVSLPRKRKAWEEWDRRRK